MPEKMSAEKANILRVLNAEIIRTPTAAKYDDPDSHISVAQKLNKKLTRSVILDQYVNPGNPLAHYDTTALEILEQCDYKVDMVVICAGTGGTITGISRRIKETLPNCKIVGVDPKGSILAQPDSLNETDVQFYEVEGIGYDFIPTVLDRNVIDEWVKTDDKESLIMARELISQEGLLCGGSSGSAMVAAMKVAKDLKENQTCVVIFPDGVRNYMSKFIDDQWMADRGFLTKKAIKTRNKNRPFFLDFCISALSLGANPIKMSMNAKISEAIETMKKQGIDQMPVIDDQDFLQGMVTVMDTMKMLVNGSATREDPVYSIMIKTFPVLNRNQSIGDLISLLKLQPYVVIVEQVNLNDRKVVGIITHVDILNYFING